MQTPAASLIISAYNNADWLQRCLWGYAQQDRLDFELIVTDDGSGPAVGELVAGMADDLPFPVRHVWHEDAGFRKCTILNRGIEVARSDYLVFSDGDCVPRADFVSQHLRLREPGRYLGGGYCKLPMDLSLKIDRAVIERGLHTDLDWLKANGLPRKKRSLKLWARPGWRERALNALTPTKARWAGNNASGWKADLVRVNGFDERMTYGGEDLELGERLANAGVTGKQIRFSAVCIHLDHARGYVKPDMKAANQAIRDVVQAERRTWTDYGLVRGPKR
ncbi:MULTISPECIES: glycosyltransferase family 2 protein [Luteimonas]|uniref:glycosyltransferase family 2 protein n=1 Tax=Luteimonas TaxID=83614 RepID=UPI000C7C2C85|nr:MULTISPECIES: glycosyltransferase family 2 protein [Luteimonas]